MSSMLRHRSRFTVSVLTIVTSVVLLTIGYAGAEMKKEGSRAGETRDLGDAEPLAEQLERSEGLSREDLRRGDRDRLHVALDRDLELRLTLRLLRSPSFANSDLDVSAEKGVATVSGTVASEDAKERALRIVRRTSGVREIRDELRVDAAAVAEPAQVSDRDLARRVAETLTESTLENAHAEQEWAYGWEIDNDDDKWEFDVDVDEGQVTLEGSVGSADDLRRITEAAHDVAGVRSVQTDLRIIGSRYEPWGLGYAYRGPYGYYPNYRPFDGRGYELSMEPFWEWETARDRHGPDAE